MSSRPLRAVLGDYPLIILDEAQRIADIGIKLKLLVDNYPDIQIIVELIEDCGQLRPDWG